MAETSTIEWTDATWTPIRARRFVPETENGWPERIGWHCEHVSEGCRHCYAESINKRLGTGREFKPAHLIHHTAHGDKRGDVQVFLDGEMLLRPLRWRRPRMIFACSMTDLFADFVPFEFIDKVFAVMALAPHTFQVLTKRARRMRQYFTEHAAGGRHIWEAAQQIQRPRGFVDAPTSWPLPRVWLGVSAEDQDNADARLRDLLATPARVRFVSVEPMLGPVEVFSEQTGELLHTSGDEYAPGSIDWIIGGGESGPLARPAQLAWARSLRDQCQAAGVPFLWKQWGTWAPGSNWPDDVVIPSGTCDRLDADYNDRMWRVGKKAAGRLLDGVTHDGFPEQAR